MRSTRRQNGLTNGKKRIPRQTAKIVSVTAIGAIMCVNAFTSWPDTTTVSATLHFGNRPCPSFTNSGKNQISTRDPRRFESVCESAVRFASAVPPIAAIQPVAVVPTFAPKSTAIATSYEMSPCVAIAIAIAIVAAEDWMTAVRSIAQSAMRKTPDIRSALMRVKIAETSGFSRIGETPLDMM